MARKKGDLTSKQWAFCHQYVKDRNASQAAFRAGYSADTCGQIGYQLLQKTSIKNLIEKLSEQQAEKLKITREMILARIATTAFADISDFMKWSKTGKKIFKPSHELGDKAGAIESFETTKEGIKIKLRDSDKAAESLYEKLGFNKDGSNADEGNLRAQSERVSGALQRHRGKRGSG